MLHDLFDLLYEFRFTRWLVAALFIGLLAWLGSLSSLGGWAVAGCVAAVALLPDVLDHLFKRDPK